MTRTQRRKEQRQRAADFFKGLSVFFAAWAGVIARRYRASGQSPNFFEEQWFEILLAAAVAQGISAGLDVARGLPRTEAQRQARRSQWAARLAQAFIAGLGADGAVGDI